MTTQGPALAAAALDPRLVHGLEELFGLSAEDLRSDAELEGDLQLDSLASVELQVWLEDAVGVRLATAENVAPPRTLGALQARLDAALDRDRRRAEMTPEGSR